MSWEEQVSKVFGLNEETWLNHANPLSVYTRFSVPALLALAIWSWQWIGWYCLIPIAVVISWNFLNPLIFHIPGAQRTGPVRPHLENASGSNESTTTSRKNTGYSQVG